jgi:hypothetical protein
MEQLMMTIMTRSATALAVIAMAIMAQPASAADPAAKKRCADLVAFYDRWGTTKTPDHSDGARNHNRINAEFDCARGDYATGIAKMEAQIRNRVRMDVPVQIGEFPLLYPVGHQAVATAER